MIPGSPVLLLQAYLLSRSESSEEEGAAEGSAATTQAPAPAAPAAAAPAAVAGDSGTAAGSVLQGITLPPPATAALLVATGAIAGVASGLLGVGGGLIVTPLLALAQDYSQATVLGTSLFAMIAPASAALLQHQRCVCSGCAEKGRGWCLGLGRFASSKHPPQPYAMPASLSTLPHAAVWAVSPLRFCTASCLSLPECLCQTAGWAMLTGAWLQLWQPALQRAAWQGATWRYRRRQGC